MEHRRERRQLEWRISLGIWVFLAAAIGSSGEKLKLFPIWGLSIFLLLIVIGHVVGYCACYHWI
jgi:hypothetical protein